VDAEEDRVARASYAPVPIGSHTPQPLPFTAAPDAPSVTLAPFHCVGRIESSAGSGTGTAVNEQTVVTAAGLLFDKDKLAYADQVSWLHQHDPAVHRASQRVPRALILGGYASQLEVERQTGTGDHPLGSLVSDNLDVGVIYFGGDSAARSGFTGFLADYSPVAGFNPWLLGTTEKILCGYPGVGVSNPGVMHATAASSLPLVTVQHQVFASATFGGLPGMTGAPLFCRHANGSLYPAAIYLGENGGARFRGFDRDVAELIHRADYIAAVLRSAGTGGGEQFTDTLQGDDFPIAMVKVEIPNGMGRWRLAERVPPHEARTVWFQSEERVPVIAGSWDVEFEPLPGFVAPPRQALEVSGGEAPTLIAPTSYSITWESWSETAFTAAERSNPLLSGSAADLDRDGIPNLMEFAFGLPPKLPGRTSFDPGSATPGMPLSQVVRVGGAPRLEISFLRRPADIAPGLTYVVEFADSPAGPWNAAETQTEETSLLNPNWKYVKATESPGSPAGRKFSRVRVEYQPPPP
jgi:hypothetical protein